MIIPWDIKYSPTSIDKFIFQDGDTKNYFNQIVTTQTIPHLFLHGGAGCGKTSLVRILIEQCGINKFDVLWLNASDDNNVETIRSRILTFIKSSSFGEYKVIVLDEADYITKEAQAILRGVMVDYALSAKFILTCNFEQNVLGALQSRCEVAEIKAGDKFEISEHIINILVAEEVKFDNNTLDYVENYVNLGYPDIRKIIKLIQKNTINGVLVKASDVIDITHHKDMLIKLLSDNNWMALRLYSVDHFTTIAEYDTVYKCLYENLHIIPKFEKNMALYEEAILVIAEYLVNNAKALSPDIIFTACCLTLCKL
jgi:replication factor C subunit 2/4